MRLLLILSTTLIVACAGAGNDEAKVSDTSAESTISNLYTTVVGELPLGSTTSDAIDHPDYYLGRTMQLHAGQKIEINLRSNRKSLVHVYGPATGWDGEAPQFGTALVRTTTSALNGKQVRKLTFTASAPGTYMLVYGPTNVWRATYQITATCKDNCDNIAAEGEECGGFVPADLFQVCEPELTCVAPEGFVADAPGNCGALVTVAELVANKAAYDGRYVAVLGTIAAQPFCTKIGCSVSNPCCNQCSANQRLFDSASQVGSSEGIFLMENNTELGCSGNECNPLATCAIENGNAWVSGWFRVDGEMGRLDLVRRYVTP